MLLGQHFSMLSTILFGIVTPDCGLIQAQQYYLMLLTTTNNVTPTTLLHSVFNNLLQPIIFCRVVQALGKLIIHGNEIVIFEYFKSEYSDQTNFQIVDPILNPSSQALLYLRNQFGSYLRQAYDLLTSHIPLFSTRILTVFCHLLFVLCPAPFTFIRVHLCSLVWV